MSKVDVESIVSNVAIDKGYDTNKNASFIQWVILPVKGPEIDIFTSVLPLKYIDKGFESVGVKSIDGDIKECLVGMNQAEAKHMMEQMYRYAVASYITDTIKRWSRHSDDLEVKIPDDILTELSRHFSADTNDSTRWSYNEIDYVLQHFEKTASEDSFRITLGYKDMLISYLSLDVLETYYLQIKKSDHLQNQIMKKGVEIIAGKNK